MYCLFTFYRILVSYGSYSWKLGILHSISCKLSSAYIANYKIIDVYIFVVYKKALVKFLDCGKFHVTHDVMFLLSTGRSECMQASNIPTD